MNALAHYLLLLSETSEIEGREADTLRQDARVLYSRLEVIDADRQGRYRDMGKFRTRLMRGLDTDQTRSQAVLRFQTCCIMHRIACLV